MSSENINQKNPLAVEKTGRLIARFAIPAIISMLVSSLYNIVDQIFIGQGVGMLGNAATNIAFPISIICTATALFLGIGSASNYNLESGAGRPEKAVQIAGTGLFMLAVCGILIGVVVLAFLDQRLYRDHSIRDSFFDSYDRRQSYYKGGQKPVLFHGVHADGGDYQYDS